ncbi:MAG: polyphosphate polymerase domain-containing protein [Bacilli bacterium]|nr:polyphosphate polymerase domain-containing protein [Bacilli bacterium]
MIQKVFKRVEQKYVLSEEQFLKLQDILDKRFTPDKFFFSKIYNLYFDNDNFDNIITSIEKPEYKSKIRLRSYGEASNDDYIYLEMKKKYKGTVYKRRINLTLKDFKNYQENKSFPRQNKQIMQEIDYQIKYQKLKPKIFVAYDRLSYYSKEDDHFRITFDYNLRSRFKNLELKDSKKDELYFDTITYIMEVKCLFSLPIWFVSELNKLKIYPKSFSKVGNIYIKERGKKNVRKYIKKYN